MKSGIYKIYNVITGKFYIGSAVNIVLRWRQHKSLLKNNKHSSKYLQNSYNIYKPDDFQFSILAKCPNEYLLKLEQWFIDNLKPEYNTARVAGSNLGLKMSDETKLKMSKSNLGKVRTEEHKKHLSKINKGKTLSELHKNKLSIAKSKPVYKICQTTNTIEEYSSISEASLKLKMSRGTITKLIKTNKPLYGYLWKYKESSYISRRSKLKIEK